MRRVVVTGLGVITPLGSNVEKSWLRLKQGLSGIKLLDRQEFKGLDCRIGGEVTDFNPSVFLSQKEIQRWDPFVHYAVAATSMALADAGLYPSVFDNRLKPEITSEITSGRIIGIIIGSSRGGIRTITENIKRDLSGRGFSAYLMSATTPFMAAAAAAMKYNLRGQSLGISTACASGTHAIGEAFRWIQHGYANIVVAGGADAALCRTALGGYDAAKALSRRNNAPEKASRPFDAGRDGFVVSEGAGIIVLESYESAKARGATIHGEVIGYGQSTDAAHETRPEPEGEARAMEMALLDAEVRPEDIGFINAHGTSTVIGDRVESVAIKKIFSGKAAGKIPVTANKSVTGHMLGAGGAVETVFTLLSLKEGVIPATINLEDSGSKCDLDYVTGGPRAVSAEVAMSNSFGFGGCNAVLVLRIYQSDQSDRTDKLKKHNVK